MNSARSLFSSPVSPPLRSIVALRNLEHYPYDLKLANSAEVRRHCSVIAACVKVRSALQYELGGHKKRAAARKGGD